MSFTSLATATPENWRHIIAEEGAMPYGRRVSEGLMLLLRQQENDGCFGMPVNTYRHCLQTATRVLNAGGSNELVVCSLFHDVPEKLAPFAHGAAIADMLKPYISEQNEWMLRHHPVFQQYHFAHHPTIDRHAREALRGSPYFAYAADYCATYDENSFDPDFPTLPIERFEPIVEAYFSRFNSLKSLRLGG
jgi:predicted HD phosphohydrolase